MSEQCCAKVWVDWSRAYYQCSRKGKVQVNGKWYCGQHDPNAVKRRNLERDAKWKRESEMRSAKWRVDAAKHAFVDACLHTRMDRSLVLCDETIIAFRVLLDAQDAYANLCAPSEKGIGNEVAPLSEPQGENQKGSGE